jgi:hypothetical protein
VLDSVGVSADVDSFYFFIDLVRSSEQYGKLSPLNVEIDEVNGDKWFQQGSETYRFDGMVSAKDWLAVPVIIVVPPLLSNLKKDFAVVVGNSRFNELEAGRIQVVIGEVLANRLKMGRLGLDRHKGVR